MSTYANHPTLAETHTNADLYALACARGLISTDPEAPGWDPLERILQFAGLAYDVDKVDEDGESCGVAGGPWIDVHMRGELIHVLERS